MFVKLLEKSIRHGTLHLRLPDGSTHTFGSGPPEVTWRIHSRRAVRRILRNPDLQLGETYVEGLWDVEGDDLVGLLEVLLRNFSDRWRQERPGSRWLTWIAAAWQQWNRIPRSYRNAAHHYDLDEHLFRCFLDEDLQYSCAYFRRPDVSLEEAQRAKCEHIARKLLLEPDMRVLDIGCGWGGLALFLAERCGARVTGLTLSAEQLRVARDRAAGRGLQDRVEFRLEDYREHRGRYDRIVSVGMFEHVGRPHYGRFFRRVQEMLEPDGVALIHTIGRTSPPGTTNPWIRKYIFPGGYIPALSEVSRSIEGTALLTTDVEVLRLHYAMTLAEWHRRFRRARPEISRRMGERFCRMWAFYLAASEASFRWDDMVVFQIQLAPDHAAVPLTREYQYPWPAQLAAVDGAHRPTGTGALLSN